MGIDYEEITKEQLIDEYQKISIEYDALLKSSRAILKNEDFVTAAQEIFNYCKLVTGATSGYVALLSDDGSENEVLFLDSGGLECTVDENLPMPIRGLRSRAYFLKKGVYDNDFDNSEWLKYMPEGHMYLENVLFAPLIIENNVLGLIGLANKAEGFNDRDVSFISTLGDIAALSLRNSNNTDLLKASEEKYRLITEHVTDVIWIYNIENKAFAFISPSIKSLTGYSIEEASAKSLAESFAKESSDKLKDIIKSKLKELKSSSQEKVSFLTEVQQLCKDGGKVWIELSGNIYYNFDKQIEVVGLSRNIDEKKKVEEELLYLSSHDQLTKLYNRHFFVNKLEELENSNVYPTAIISADLNGLKRINDTYGHRVGDKYIQICAKILDDALRDEDILARVGGDEFAIVLPNINEEIGKRIIERIKESVNHYNEKTNRDFDLGIALGLAVCESKNTSLEETMNIADRMMYQDKNS